MVLNEFNDYISKLQKEGNDLDIKQSPYDVDY